MLTARQHSLQVGITSAGKRSVGSGGGSSVAARVDAGAGWRWRADDRPAISGAANGA